MSIKPVLQFIAFLAPLFTFAQQQFSQSLQNMPGVTVTQVKHNDFKEYYEIMVEQPLDHFNPGAKVFKQRIFVGINDPVAPTVMETEGYAVNRPAMPDFLKGCNYVSVEHRYFGKSVPDNSDWTYLTIKQAAYDCHHIHELLKPILTGKWMTTGISKGGQTAIAYKMYFPNDADATLAYVTPVKNGLNDNRIQNRMDSLAKTETGKKVYAFQKNAFINKAELLKTFDAFIYDNHYKFGRLKSETVLEYMLLEYPFAFFQNGGDTSLIPAATASPKQALDEIVNVVPIWFFTETFRPKLQPSFYMFYNELGYYEYNLIPYKQWLSAKSYPNNIFAPQNISVTFDPTYLNDLQKFISKPTIERLIFIYGELDPYTAAQAPVENNKNCLKLIVKGGSHKSRVAHLSAEQQQQVYGRLSAWLSWPIGVTGK
jgi:hypothetical protein